MERVAHTSVGELYALGESRKYGEGVSKSRRYGVDIVTARDFAKITVETGERGPFGSGSFVVAENFVFAPEGVYVTDGRCSPSLKEPSEAAKGWWHNGYYPHERLVKAIRRKARKTPKEAIKSGVLLLPEALQCNHEIRFNEFSKHPLTSFLFRDQAEPYGNYLTKRLQASQSTKIRTWFIGGERSSIGSRYEREKGAYANAVRLEGTGGAFGGGMANIGGLRPMANVFGLTKKPLKQHRLLHPNDLEELVGAVKAGRSFSFNGRRYEPVPAR